MSVKLWEYLRIILIGGIGGGRERDRDQEREPSSGKIHIGTSGSHTDVLFAELLEQLPSLR